MGVDSASACAALPPCESDAPQPAERFRIGVVGAVAAGHGVHEGYSNFLAPLMIVFKESLSLSNTQAGLLSVFMQEASLIQPLFGGIVDRYSGRLFVALVPAVTGAVMSVLGLSTSYLSLAILLTVASFSSASIHTAGPMMICNAAGRKLGLATSLWMVGGEFGRFVGPLAIGAVITFRGIRSTPWLMIGGLVASALLLAVLKDDREARQVSAQRFRGSMATLLRGRRRVTIIIVGLVLTNIFTSVSLITYLPLLLHGAGESLWLASIAVSVIQAAGVAGALTGGTLSDRWGRRKLLLSAIPPTALLTALFAGVDGWVRFPLLALLGFTSLSISPVLMALMLESYPQNRALANGIYMALNFIFRSVVVVILGRVGDLFGLQTAFVVGGATSLLGIPLVLMLPVKNARAEGG